MKRIGALAIAAAMTVAACGGSDETTPEPDVEVEAVKDDGAFRLAGSGQVVNGCRIEPNTQCPGADLRKVILQNANLSNANLQGANLSRATLIGVDPSGANLSRANLELVTMFRANLDGANLNRTRFCMTLMPDGSLRSDSSSCYLGW